MHKCSFHPLSRRLLCETDRDPYRKPQTPQIKSWGAQSQWIHLQNTPVPKALGTLQEIDCKRQRIREFAVRLCLSLMSEASPRNPPQCDCPNMSWTKMTPCQTGQRKLTRPQPYTMNYRQLWKAGHKMRKVVFPRKRHTTWLFNAKWSAMIAYIQVKKYMDWVDYN